MAASVGVPRAMAPLVRTSGAMPRASHSVHVPHLLVSAGSAATAKLAAPAATAALVV